MTDVSGGAEEEGQGDRREQRRLRGKTQITMREWPSTLSSPALQDSIGHTTIPPSRELLRCHPFIGDEVIYRTAKQSGHGLLSFVTLSPCQRASALSALQPDGYVLLLEVRLDVSDGDLFPMKDSRR